MIGRFAEITLHQARRLVVTVIGFSVLLAGVALLFLPGPAVLVIPAGLAILATEFVWARRWLRRLKREAQSLLGSDPESDVAQDQAGDA
ncbi:MAG: PGPGW domain-containing protein [Phycisphaerae bacterium]|nr:PGPGW domain-containing protein [Phycisphaerae bacterium]